MKRSLSAYLPAVFLLALAVTTAAAAAEYHEPSVAYDTVNDRHLLIQVKTDDFGSSLGIVGEVVDCEGNTLVSEFAVSDPAGDDEWTPSTAYDPITERYLVAWDDNRNTAVSSRDIYGQLVAADGSPVGSDFVICEAASYQQYPKAAYDPEDGIFLVVWQDYRDQPTQGTEIYGRFVSADGALLGSERRVSDSTGDEEEPAVACSTQGGRCLVTWHLYDAATDYDIHADFVSYSVTAASALAGGGGSASFAVIATAGGQSYPDVAFDRLNNRYLVAWYEDALSSSINIQAQLVNTNRSLEGAPFLVSSQETGQYDPAVAFDDVNGRFLVAWEDNRDSTPDIYGVFVAADGGIGGDEFAVSSATGSQSHPALDYNANAAAFMTALETRETGAPTVALVTVGDPCPGQATLYLPNGGEEVPSGSTCTVRWGTPHGAEKVKLKYSLNNGVTWNLMKRNERDREYAWEVPVPRKNKKKCLVRAVAYDADGLKLGADRSDDVFAVEVVKVLSPAGGEIVPANTEMILRWRTNATRRPVDRVLLQWTPNGGATWKRIVALEEDTGTFAWTPPEMPADKTECKVRVILKDEAGTKIGVDKSDGFFTLQAPVAP